MLSIQSYLATHALGEFRLSFWRFGPTELRILLAVGNLALLWKPQVHFLGGQYRLFDVGGAIGLAGMALMVVFFTAQNTVRLYREERIAEVRTRIGDNLTACLRVLHRRELITGARRVTALRWLKFNLVGGIRDRCAVGCVARIEERTSSQLSAGDRTRG